MTELVLVIILGIPNQIIDYIIERSTSLKMFGPGSIDKMSRVRSVQISTGRCATAV